VLHEIGPYWLLILVPLVLPFLFLVWNPAAFRQKTDEVVTREPGRRSLGAPKPVSTEAVKDLEFAWLSQSAYEKTPAAKHAPRSADCPDPEASLQANGWKMWQAFPSPEVQEKIDNAHLRVEVWQNESRSAVAVAFGGTVFNNEKDWKSNLRWFLPKQNDEYTETVRVFAPVFKREFLNRSQQPGHEFLSRAILYSTGHSLGGGLAQQFAYGLPLDEALPRVSHVFAFDPSPVTGFYSVTKKIRNLNRRTLAIDRVYERGEILALVRSLTSFIYPPSAKHPTIRQVRYNLFPTWNPIAGHSMTELACKLTQAVQKSRAATNASG